MTASVYSVFFLALVLIVSAQTDSLEDVNAHWKKTDNIDKKQVICLQFAVKHDPETLTKLEHVTTLDAHSFVVLNHEIFSLNPYNFFFHFCLLYYFIFFKFFIYFILFYFMLSYLIDLLLVLCRNFGKLPILEILTTVVI